MVHALLINPKSKSIIYKKLKNDYNISKYTNKNSNSELTGFELNIYSNSALSFYAYFNSEFELNNIDYFEDINNREIKIENGDFKMGFDGNIIIIVNYNITESDSKSLINNLKNFIKFN